MSETGLSAEAIEQLTSLAMNPQWGVPFTMGGKTFARQFLTIDAEQALRSAMGRDGASAMAPDALLRSGVDLLRAAAIVLVDQDPECTEAWLRKTRGVTTLRLADIVAAQLALGEVVPLLAQALDARRTAVIAGRGATAIIPESAAAAGFIEWACGRYGGRHPSAIRREYSQALLLVLFDAFWWRECAPAPEAEKGLDGQELKGESEFFAGLGGGGAVAFG